MSASTITRIARQVSGSVKVEMMDASIVVTIPGARSAQEPVHRPGQLLRFGAPDSARAPRRITTPAASRNSPGGRQHHSTRRPRGRQTKHAAANGAATADRTGGGHVD